MRRKVLVLLLTLTLVLSFMPMIAFADIETESTEPVKETAEAEKVEAEEPAQDSVEAEASADVTAAGEEESAADAEASADAATEEESTVDSFQQIVKGRALTALASDIDPEECEHEHTYTSEDWDPDKATYAEVDNKYHVVTGQTVIETWCEDCDTKLSEDLGENFSREETHSYDENNKCKYCHHENTCAHENTETYPSWDNEKVSYTAVDNRSHEVTGPGETVVWCEDCDTEISREAAQIDVVEEHEYENQECTLCHHKNTCAHDGETSTSENRSEEVTFEPIDNKYHRITGPGEEITWCEICGSEISRTDIQIDDKEEHEYDENHVCRDCGHVNTCAHKNTGKDEIRDWDSAEYTPIDDSCHKVTGPVDIITWCKDCGETLSVDTKDKEDEADHDYDENHVCVDCNYTNTCKHEHTKSDYTWESKDVDYTPKDNKYHKVTGPGELITWCTDCGETFKREKVDSVDAEEDHGYDANHVCKDCGYENKCKHEHTEPYYVWDNDEVDYSPINNTYHKVTGPGKQITWCMDCGEDFKSEDVGNVDAEEFHDYNSDHVCEYCEHKNTCTHSSKYYEYYFDPDWCTITDTGDGVHHNVKGRITKYTYCKTCEECLSTEKLGRTTVKEIHYYNKDDVCRYCGYNRASAGDNTRIFGKGRYDTAIAAAEKYKGASGKFENVIVAYGQNFPDALSGGYLAKVKNAPILLVELAEEARIVDYISKNIASGGKVYLLGGTGVVSSAFESKVKAKGIATKRLGGSSRYETNLAILKEAGVKDEDILVCTGAGYADSLSASAVGKPILLVDNTLSDAQKTYIKGLSSKQCYLIGGTGAVKPAIEKGLKDLGLKTERLAGSSRYETSTAVAKKFFAKAATVVLAYAQNFPDGLSGGPLAMMESAPIVLTDSKTTAAAQAYVRSAGVVKSITLGGPALISDIAVKAIMGR